LDEHALQAMTTPIQINTATITMTVKDDALRWRPCQPPKLSWTQAPRQHAAHGWLPHSGDLDSADKLERGFNK